MTDRPKYRLAADYDCHALWERRPDGGLANLSPEGLGLSDDLRLALVHWAKVYTDTLDRSDPMLSGFATDLEVELFSFWGQSLAALLAHALQEPIDYFDDHLKLDVIFE